MLLVDVLILKLLLFKTVSLCLSHDAFCLPNVANLSFYFPLYYLFYLERSSFIFPKVLTPSFSLSLSLTDSIIFTATQL